MYEEGVAGSESQPEALHPPIPQFFGEQLSAVSTNSFPIKFIEYLYKKSVPKQSETCIRIKDNAIEYLFFVGELSPGAFRDLGIGVQNKVLPAWAQGRSALFIRTFWFRS